MRVLPLYVCLFLAVCLFSGGASAQDEPEFIPVGTTTAAAPCDDPDCDQPPPPPAWETTTIVPGIPNPGPVLEAGLKGVPTLDGGLKSVVPTGAAPAV